MTYAEFLKIAEDIVNVFNAANGNKGLMSCQGQGMDGYSELANYRLAASELKKLLETT